MLLVQLVGLHRLNAQCSVSCREKPEITLFSRADIAVTHQMLLINPAANCSDGNYRIEIFTPEGAALSNVVNYRHLGQILSFRVTETGSGKNCNGTLTVADKMAPRLDCPTLFVPCYKPVTPAALGYPAATDNIDTITSAHFTFKDEFLDMDCFSKVGDHTVTAQINRTWTVKDNSGNTASCMQIIFMTRATLDSVIFPLDLDGFDKAKLNCSTGDPNNLDVTGVPTAGGHRIDPRGSCEFAVTYNDQMDQLCSSGYRVVRTWKVTDWCADTHKIGVQVIEVMDQTPPQIKCPADTLTFATQTNSCVAKVTLPAATATDDCSKIKLSIEWAFGTGSGPFYNVPVGEYPVTYIAEDDCGNRSTCTALVIVRDEEPPTPVCEERTEVTLLPDGRAVVYAETFNAGSHDNCAIERFEASRDGLEFDHYISFDCSDLGTPVMVTLRVFDRGGLYHDCMVEARVYDKTKPKVTCPADLNVFCTQDPTDISLTKEATATDQCGLSDINYSDKRDVNSCGLGKITRTWLAEDKNGNTATCNQVITVVDPTPPRITFPGDVTYYDCSKATDPDATGRPVVTGDDCETILVSHEDQLYTGSFPSCYKILRKWTAYDWCRYVADDPSKAGYWEHVQVIKVMDTIAPVLILPADTVVSIVSNSCRGQVTLPPAKFNDCSPDVRITNDSPFANGRGADISGNYPNGVYSITFTATDGCGNISSKKMKLTVRDGKAPTPVCLNYVTISLMENGTVTITPEMIGVSGSDNCTPKDQLRFDVAPNYFTCEDKGPQLLKLTLFDAEGNSGTCYTNIDIQDNFEICNPEASRTLAGMITKPSGAAAGNRMVNLKGGREDMKYTANDGSFAFQKLPNGEIYSLVPQSADDYTNGVSTLDLLRIQEHILRKRVMNSPYDLIAADIDHNGRVSAMDIVQLRRLLLRVDAAFSNNTSWRFVNSQFEFPAGQDPLQVTYPEQATTSSPFGDWKEANFIAVKVGDVDHSANTSNAAVIENRDGQSAFVLHASEKSFTAGELVEIDFAPAKDLNWSGCQWTLNFDPQKLQLENWEAPDWKGLTAENFGWNALEQGQIALSWHAVEGLQIEAGQALLKLQFKALSSGTLSDHNLRISSDVLPSESYVRSGAGEFETQPVVLQFVKPADSPAIGVTARPNPFQDEVALQFQLPEADEITLQIFDGMGRMLYRSTQQLPAGAQTWTLSPADVKEATGVLIYRVSGRLMKEQTGRMVRIRQ